MNQIIVGANKADLHFPETFLFIDDEDFSGVIPERRKVVRLDLNEHHFNPLQNTDYRKTRAFVDIIDATFPRGNGTLTKDTGLSFIRRARGKYLHKLIPVPSKTATPGHIWAYDKIDEIVSSPVLHSFLCKPTNFALDGIVLAKLDRKILTDFEAYLIGNFLISNYQGHVVIPDYGFYTAPFHASLIRQGRLSAGVNSIAEFPFPLSLMSEKLARTCLAEDARKLAEYRGLIPGEVGHSDFVRESVA